MEPVQGGLAGLGGDEADAEKLRGGDHEHVRDGGDVHGQVLEKKLVPLFLGEIGLNRPQVDEDGEALEIGDMMQRGGGGGRRAVRQSRAPTGCSNFSIRHAD